MQLNLEQLLCSYSQVDVWIQRKPKIKIGVHVRNPWNDVYLPCGYILSSSEIRAMQNPHWWQATLMFSFFADSQPTERENFSLVLAFL